MTVDPRRARIQKGMFMTSSPCPPGDKRQPLPDDLQEFEAAAARADEIAAMERRRAAAIAELSRRLQKVRDELATFQKARRK